MSSRIFIILKWISVAYVALFALSLVAYISADLPEFDEVGHLKNGCYTTNALLPSVECNGLPANTLVKFALSFWYFIIYGAVFLFQFPLGTLYGLVVLSPGLYLLWYFIKGRHLTRG